MAKALLNSMANAISNLDGWFNLPPETLYFRRYRIFNRRLDVFVFPRIYIARPYTIGMLCIVDFIALLLRKITTMPTSPREFLLDCFVIAIIPPSFYYLRYLLENASWNAIAVIGLITGFIHGGLLDMSWGFYNLWRRGDSTLDGYIRLIVDYRSYDGLQRFWFDSKINGGDADYDTDDEIGKKTN